MDFRAQIYLPTFEDTIVQGGTNIDGDLSDCEGVVEFGRNCVCGKQFSNKKGEKERKRERIEHEQQTF